MAQIPVVKAGQMTDEQVGTILRFSDELSEYNKGLEFIEMARTEKQASDYIENLVKRIEIAGTGNEETKESRI